MKRFVKSAFLLFVALRAGDLVSVAAGMWFVPRYVSPDEIGAVLPLTSMATFISIPVFAFAMTMMRESACLSASGERGKIKSLLRGMFVATAIGVVAVLALSFAVAPRFIAAMRVDDSAAGFLVVAAAFLGCVAPVYTDALQALKRFGSLAAVEFGGAVARFLVMLATMPVRALAGYFAGQATLPLVRMAGSVLALRRDLSVAPEPYWTRETVRRVTLAFVAIAAYQAAPMAASLVEQSILRTSLPAVDSAGYYMVSRFSDFLHYLTFPLLLVMFPYTAAAAHENRPTSPYVRNCAIATLVAATVMVVVYALFGGSLLALMPHGEEYAQYVPYMPWLVVITALTTCQVFQTNAEVSAGRFGFLWWLIPLHIAYPVALYIYSSTREMSLVSLLVWFSFASIARFAFAIFCQNNDFNRH